MIEKLETQLDNFQETERKAALTELHDMADSGKIDLPPIGHEVNIHCHTFFSFNTYGYSPSKFAWLARKRGLAVAGVVDFDVLDALHEFLDACRLLGLKSCAGLESRVYVPEFATRVMTSPGEPGITYHMAMGFPKAELEGPEKDFLLSLRRTAQERNQGLMGRVNAHLSPLELDYDRDVLVLTPSGNATERHMCLAYARKAHEQFPDIKQLAEFWSEKLSLEVEESWLPENRPILDAIRAKTMKRGGVGYVQPGEGAFPLMADMNRFAAAAGAIPLLTWLDGTSDGEKDIEELLEVAMSTGAAAVNVIPDRNYTPGAKDEKLANLNAIVALAEKLHLPIVMGTEMNSPGQKFVDDFDSEELKPLAPIFLKGAHIMYAHSVLQQNCGLGYVGKWAKDNFETTEKKNKFYQTLGATLDPKNEHILAKFSEESKPEQILEATE